MTFAAFLMMRPLHRPIHDKFIFSDKWDAMSKSELEEAIKAGKIRVPKNPEEFKKMKNSDLQELRKQVRPIFEEIRESFTSILKQMPKSLLLICR